MDIIKTAIGENGDNISGQTGIDQKIKNGVGIGKIIRLKAPGPKILHQTCRGKLVFRCHIGKGYMLANNYQITGVKGMGILLLKNRPAAGIGPRFKHGD